MRMKQSFLIKNSKAQTWSLDLVIASTIFMMGIIILYVYAINYSSQTRDQLDELFYEGNLVSKLILSEKEFGILSEGKVNQTKLENLYNTDYQTIKGILGLTNDFYFKMEELEINGSSIDYVGKINNIEVGSLIQTTRLTIYKNSPTKFQLFIWQIE